jgi:hypothetical protein
MKNKIRLIFTLALAIFSSAFQSAINGGDNAGAVDANGSPFTTDQRGTGFPRIDPGGNTVNVRSFEYVDPCLALTGNTVFVNATVSGSGDGNSWATAVKTLQEALVLANLCSNITQIWVAAGTYYPDEGGSQVDNDRNATFTLKNGLAIYGGFAGTETILDDRDWRTNITILSGDIGLSGVATDNSFHIISLRSISDVRVDGFTVSDGFMAATDVVDARAGAGIFMSRTSNITLDHLRIINNTAVGSGPEISPGSGGGIYVERTTGTTSLTNSIFQNNHAGFGGGVYSLLANSLTVSNTIFRSNSALWGGGGVIHRLGESFMVVGCLFDNNVAVSDDGQSGSGGGVQIEGGGSTVFTNTVFSSNQANGLNDDGGGAMIVFGGIVGLVNSTMSDNTTASTTKPDGNAICLLETGFGIQEINLINTIVWGTAVTQLHNEGSVNYDHSFVKGISGSDPLFVNSSDPDGADNVFGTADDGLMIANNSPAINAGTNTGAPNNDVTGNLRALTVEDPADIGAYELPPCVSPAGLSTTNITSTSAQLNWNPVAGASKYKLLYRQKGASSWTTVKRKGTAVSYTLSALTPSTTYNWKIKTVCSSGQSQFSIVKKFTTASAFVSHGTTTTPESAMAESMDVAAMPNPNNGNFTVDLHLPANKANTTLQLYNDFGVKVWQEDLGIKSGRIVKNIYLENKLATGLYMLMVQRSDGVYTAKIVVSK